MVKRRIIIIFALLLSLGLLAGCAQSFQEAKSTFTNTVTPVFPAVPSPTPWLLDPAPKANLQPTSEPIFLCNGKAALSGFPGLPCRMELNLKPNLPEELIREAFQAENITLDRQQILITDLNHDGKPDYVLSIPDPDSRLSPKSGLMLVYLCGEMQCSLVWKSASPEGTSAPTFERAQDLNSDGSTEILTGYTSCNAYSCSKLLHLYNWNGQSLENRMEGASSDLPNPVIEVRPRGGKPAIWVTGSSVQSVSAGVQRSLTRVWVYSADTGRWQVAAEEKAPAVYRIHALQDAEAFFKQRLFDRAVPIFERIAINQPPYQDFLNSALEQEYINAYARFRLVMIAVLEGDKAAQDRWTAELRKYAETSAVNQAYLEAVSQFADQWAGQSPEKTCELLMQWGRRNLHVLEELGAQRFGFTNREFLPADLCP